MPRIALTNELPELPDGTYAIGIAGTTVRFQVHTVTIGTLAGQRIIKYRRVDGSFKGFAFIKVEADSDSLSLCYEGIQIWRSQQGNITETYARNVSQAIRRFIARVYVDREDLSDFIVIEACPELPINVRMRLRLNTHTADPVQTEPPTEQRSWTPTRGLRPLRQRQTSTFAHLNSEPEDMDSRQSPPLRVTRLAMSCFHPEEVR